MMPRVRTYTVQYGEHHGFAWWVYGPGIDDSCGRPFHWRWTALRFAKKMSRRSLEYTVRNGRVVG